MQLPFPISLLIPILLLLLHPNLPYLHPIWPLHQWLLPDSNPKKLVSPTLDQQPLCIEMSQLEVAFELKPGMIHLLPNFHGLSGENLNNHLKEFHVVCSSMKSFVIFMEQVKLRVFPFSLANNAKEWLYYLPLGTITRWNDMKKNS